MFQFHDIGGGHGGGAAALTLDRPLHRAAFAPAFAPRFAPVKGFQPSGLAPAKSRLKAMLAELELVTDLGAQIGSREWRRGFVVCVALCYSAYAFAPGIEPLIGASPAPLADAQWEEARALTISPLAYGADTGRRMAATDAVEPLADTPERPSIDLLATLSRGDAFGRVLRRAGVGKAEADSVAEMVGDAIPLSELNPGTTIDVTLGRRPSKDVARPLDALSFRAAFDLKLEVRRIGGSLRLIRHPIAVDETPLRIQGRVGSSLYRSARAVGAPARAVEAYIRAIAGQIDIGSVGADDRFDIILKHRRAATGETETGELLYAGLDRARAKDLQLMRWEQGGRTQWFEASGVGRTSGMLQRPVPGTVSSNFGMRRHPILGYSRMHKGMDFRAGYGTPILAATAGRVVRAGWAGGYGKQVRLSHPGDLATSYSHMSRIVAQPGQYVRQGQIIGYVGSTGLSTGPHLHYELYRNGRPVNPASVKFTTRAQLSGGALASFRSKLRNLLAVRAAGVRPSQTRTATAEATKKAGKA